VAAAGRHETAEGGRRLSWRSGGRGPALVLINGYAGTADDWDPAFVAVLEGAFEVVRPDNRGVGGAPLGDPAGLTVEAMADDVAALMDALGLAAADVAGWSMGGFVAQALACRAPGRVRSLALVSTDPGGAAAVPGDPAVWARLTDHSGTAREQAARLNGLLFPAPLADAIDHELGDAVAVARAGLAPEALAAQERAMADWHAREPAAAPRPAPPALALHGGADVVIPPANAARLAGRWPGCGVELIAGAGHAVMAQEPVRVAAMIAAHAGGPGVRRAPPRPA
jgi:pimeloyl-ACP methyl ester carboxylesterase